MFSQGLASYAKKKINYYTKAFLFFVFTEKQRKQSPININFLHIELTIKFLSSFSPYIDCTKKP